MERVVRMDREMTKVSRLPDNECLVTEVLTVIQLRRLLRLNHGH